MSQNHVLEDGKSEEEEGRISLRKKELEVFVIKAIHQVMEQNIVPTISRIVKQEVASAVETIWARLNHHSVTGVQSSESRILQLKFLDKLFQPVLTGQTIKGEGNTQIRVALEDVTTEEVVTDAYPEVEIVVVEGDFDGNNWTVEEFNRKIVREKEGKKCLLTGNVRLNLESGVGFVGKISFTHNRHWMKACKLRLGAKLVGNYNGARVREAVTEAFVLGDCRKTYTEKHVAPSLTDEVFRLKMISKGGRLHNLLIEENIKTVKDLLTRFFTNPQSLRNILGTAKTWGAIVDHAQKCVLDKTLHLFFPIHSDKRSGVVFNVVGQVMGLIFECHYVPLDMLSEDQKAEANKLVVSALEPTKELMSFDDEICMHSYLQSLNNAYQSNSPRLESPSHYSCETSHTHYGHDHTQPSTSSYYGRVVPSNIPSTDSTSIWSSDPSFGNASHFYEDGWILNEDSVSGGPSFCLENLLDPSISYAESTILQGFNMDNSCQYQFSSPEAIDDLNSIMDLISSPTNYARTRWSKLSTVLRSVRKIRALKVVSSEPVHASKRPRVIGV